jgi:hypothetical protein
MLDLSIMFDPANMQRGRINSNAYQHVRYDIILTNLKPGKIIVSSHRFLSRNQGIARFAIFTGEPTIVSCMTLKRKISEMLAFGLALE